MNIPLYILCLFGYLACLPIDYKQDQIELSNQSDLIE